MVCQITERQNARLADDVTRLATALQRMTDDRDRFAELYQEAIDRIAELGGEVAAGASVESGAGR